MRILICGDRNWTNTEAVHRRLAAFMRKHGLTPQDVLIIEGGARGADAIGRGAAEELGIPVCEFPANWDFYHKAAGPIRNGWMLRWGMPDFVMAFHPFIENSKGTKDMVTRAKKAGVECEVYSE